VDSAKPVLYGLAVALLVVNIFVSVQLGKYISQFKDLRNDFLAFQKQTNDQLNRMGVQTASSTKSAKQTITSLQVELEAAREQASLDAGAMKAEAVKRVEVLANRLAQEQQKQARLEQQLKAELSKVRDQAHTEIDEVSAEVGSMKTQVAANRIAVDRSIAALRSVNGELGVQSGLIATNHRELEALRVVGEKNYFEFNAARTKNALKVADVQVLLKKTDPKKNKFSLEIWSGDKKLEKKDRSLNEPMQFYVAKTKAPYDLVENDLYELVVNEVKKDRVIGYLSTPKSSPLLAKQ